MCERNINQLPLSHPLLGTWPTTQALGTWPTTQARALIWNQISDLLVCRPALNPLNHNSHGWSGFYLLGVF